MWHFIIQALGFFLVLKYVPSLFRIVFQRFRRPGLPPPPKKMDKETNPKTAATAVETDTDVEERIVAEAQNVSGSAADSSIAAAMASMSANTVSSTSSSSSRSESSLAYSKFVNALEKCIKEYEDLGNWLRNELYDFASDVLGIPALTEKFMALSPLKRALTLILILGILGLVGFMTWNGVKLAWPHLMNFMSSAEATEFLENAAVALQAIADSDVMKRFVATLTSASASVTGAASTEDDTEPPCFQDNLINFIPSMAFISTLDILRLFFSYMMTNCGIGDC